MKPSVPPTSFVTSISTLRLLISSRIVLPTTIATASPSSTVAKSTSRPASASMARSRATQAVSTCTSSVSGSAAIALASASTSPAMPLAGWTTSVWGSGLPSSASSASPNPDWARNSASAASRSMTVTPATSSRSSIARAVRRAASSDDVELQVDREVGGALPGVADGIGVVDGDAQARPAAPAPLRSRGSSTTLANGWPARRLTAPTRLSRCRPK